MSTLWKYGLVGVAIGAAFSNFISCGAQMYKAPMDAGGSGSELANGQADFTNPDSPEFGLHAPQGWVKLPIVYTIENDINAQQLKALQEAIATWEMAVGKKLFTFETSVKNKPGSSFPDLASALDDRLNGHYDRPSWAKTGKKTEVLATTVWLNNDADYRVIDKADIHYNTEYYFITDAMTGQTMDEREIVDMQSLALHELGHLLGLAHVSDKIDSSSIMNPSMYIGQGLATRYLSEGDVERIRKVYGCVGSNCSDNAATARQIMLTSDKQSGNKNTSTAH
jgi:hypothetical protein